MKIHIDLFVVKKSLKTERNIDTLLKICFNIVSNTLNGRDGT